MFKLTVHYHNLYKNVKSWRLAYIHSQANKWSSFCAASFGQRGNSKINRYKLVIGNSIPSVFPLIQLFPRQTTLCIPVHLGRWFSSPLMLVICFLESTLMVELFCHQPTNMYQIKQKTMIKRELNMFIFKQFQ